MCLPSFQHKGAAFTLCTCAVKIWCNLIVDVDDVNDLRVAVGSVCGAQIGPPLPRHYPFNRSPSTTWMEISESTKIKQFKFSSKAASAWYSSFKLRKSKDELCIHHAEPSATAHLGRERIMRYNYSCYVKVARVQTLTECCSFCPRNN